MKQMNHFSLLKVFRSILKTTYLFTLLLLGLMPFSGANADIVKPALVEISVFKSGTFSIELRASIEAMMTGIDGRYKNTQDAPQAEAYDELRALQANELETAFINEFQHRLLKEADLSFDGQRSEFEITKIDIPEPGYQKVPRISLILLEGTMSADAKTTTWYYPARFGDNAVRVRQVDGEAEKYYWSKWQWLRKDKPSEPFSLTEVVNPPTLMDHIQTYTIAGFDHILPKGLDHILFILGIFLLSLKIRPLFWQVTMFTLAHSITLSLSMLNIINLPANIVEPLIALSIAYIAVENIFAKDRDEKAHRTRLAVVFAFGLLHGMGFASMLADFGMPDDAFATALISFNIGVELGQLFVIAVAFLAVGLWFGQKSWYRQAIIIPCSVMIAATGLYWTVERIQF